jgi:hypothetical protein
MKSVSLIFICLLFFKFSGIAQNEPLPDSLLDNTQLLNKILPQVIEFSKNKKEYEFIERTIDSIEIKKRYPFFLVGKFIDSVRTFAITYSEKDSIIEFYRLNDNKWKEVGKEKCNIPISFFKFEELNGIKNLEIIASTYPNKNGNTWMNIYCYFMDTDIIKFAGDFCCDYNVNLNNKTIQETHEGSWDDDLYKTTYIWNKDTLVPLRHVRLSVTNPDKTWKTGKAKYEITFWENPELGYLTKYKLIFREKYNKEKHKKYWDNFYDIK